MKEDTIKSFNRIALLEDKWDHNQQYEKLLMKHIHNPLGIALDIGCGTGEFAYKLSKKVQRVVGIDLSPVMIEEACKRHAKENIEFRVEDFEEADESSQYNYIISIATFHHLNLDTALPKIKRLLKKDGQLIVLDLYERKGILDRLLDLLAIIMNPILKQIKNGTLKESPEEIQAWQEHSLIDNYMTFKELKIIYKQYLGEGIKINRLVFWRYLLVYKK